ncbi:probable inactive shikimate kinase like 1, chloroplastic [Arachis stenosperma]|uniref:probable inactive shikimate kinase like 1, chloroplastic n=1 Tax=Arachis stenosperma TaxID=217475 RepID=UPI0025AD9C1A|nr:probable inactive shikimate kinase like 1, chloroplastic [Arachis stenosperma]
MEKASNSLVTHMNTTLSLPLHSHLLSAVSSHQTFSHLAHKSCLPLRASPPSLYYSTRGPPSLSCANPDATGSKVGAVDSSLAVKKQAADVSPELKGTSIFLVGMQNSLKTSLGKMLADMLRYYYFDSDSLVEEAVGGAPAAKSFREKDEMALHESETEVLKQLSSMGRLVVCAGNGAVQSSTNLALLRHGISLWIDVPLDIMARDVCEASSSGSYPEVTDQLAALYNKYRDGYATADAIISVQKVASRLGCDNFDDITIEEMTLEALREIQKLTRVKKMLEEAARPF